MEPSNLLFDDILVELLSYWWNIVQGPQVQLAHTRYPSRMSLEWLADRWREPIINPVAEASWYKLKMETGWEQTITIQSLSSLSFWVNCQLSRTPEGPLVSLLHQFVRMSAQVKECFHSSDKVLQDCPIWSDFFKNQQPFF